MIFPLSLSLVQRIQRRSRLKPNELLRGHTVIGLDRDFGSVGFVNNDLHRLGRRQVLQSDYAHAVILIDLLVIFRIGKGKREDALLLEIRFVNAGKTTGQDGKDI